MDHPVTLTLHIGIPKTASTWLQEVLFHQLTGTVYRPIPLNTLFHSNEDMKNRLMASCLRRSSCLWAEQGDAIFTELFGEKHLWLRDPQNALISDESIGRHGSRPEQLRSHLTAIAGKAREWGFGALRILCLFRRQDQWLASHYAQMSDRNDSPSQEGFEKLVDEVLDPARSRYTFGMLLDYAALYEALTEAVGQTNTLIMPYEMLAKDEWWFRQRIFAFLKAPPSSAFPDGNDNMRVNRRGSGHNVWRLRAPLRSGWRLTASRAARTLGIVTDTPRTITVTPAITERVLETFDDSNRRLQEAIDCDLSQLGYLGGTHALSP